MNADNEKNSRGSTRMNADTAEYREYAPSAALRAYVECFWSAAPGAGTASPVRRVLPDGCVDIIVERNGSRGGVSMVGTMTRALVVESNSWTHYVGVRFRPGVARALFGIPAVELTDLRVPLAELWRDADTITERVLCAPSPARRVCAMESVLLERVRRMPPLAADVLAATQMILRAAGNLSVTALAPALGVTRQHLARSFARDVGISPKMLARVARVRAAVARIHDSVEPNWSTLALELGFYDQSHLVHDVKELTGLTPGQWVAMR